MSEAEEDRKSLTKEVDKLNDENSRFMCISKGGRGMSFVAKALDEYREGENKLGRKAKHLSDKLEETKNTHECQEYGQTQPREYPLGDAGYRRKADRRLDPVFSFSLHLERRGASLEISG